MTKPNSLPSQQIERSLERFREILSNVEFLHGVPVSMPVDKQRELEAFLQQELEAVAESAYQNGTEHMVQMDKHGKKIVTCENCESARKEAVDKIKAELERRIDFDEDTDTIFFNREIDFKNKKEVNNYEVFTDFLDALSQFN